MLSYHSSGIVKDIECTCAPCKQFWKSAFSTGADRITSLPADRADTTAILGKQNGLLKRGQRVIIEGQHKGVVQYVGIADDHLIAPEMHVGVKLYDNVYSTHNGIYNGRRFFHCARGHGAMVKYSEVKSLVPVPKTRQPTGNPMFPSFEEVKKRRKNREKKILEAEEQLKKEHEIKRKAQQERLSKSAPPPPAISPRPTRASRLRTETQPDRPSLPLQDEHDMAYHDFLEREKKREQSKPADPKAKEEMYLQRMKTAFGGDEKAERLAETLRKLYQGYEQGRIIALAERE